VAYARRGLLAQPIRGSLGASYASFLGEGSLARFHYNHRRYDGETPVMYARHSGSRDQPIGPHWGDKRESRARHLPTACEPHAPIRYAQAFTGGYTELSHPQALPIFVTYRNSRALVRWRISVPNIEGEDDPRLRS